MRGFTSVQLLSRVRLFTIPWTTARQASLSIINSRSLPKLMSIKSVMPYNHLILCHPLFLLPSVIPNIRVFSNESVLCSRWPKYWSFSFSISPFNEYSGLHLPPDLKLIPLNSPSSQACGLRLEPYHWLSCLLTTDPATSQPSQLHKPIPSDSYLS